jgi:1-acyl-sn-glycerol-3-phosphate acyltransferase
MRHIPVDRCGDAAAAYVEAVRALERGEIVGIHPEARINRSAVPRHGEDGEPRGWRRRRAHR